MKSCFGLLIIIAIFFMTACSEKKQAGLIITNATIYTADSSFSKVESFAVTDGNIVATGTVNEILKNWASENIIDATGKFIYPGFNDAHCHFYGYANNLLQYADLRGTKSPNEIYKRLKEHHEKFGGKWILGRSWDQNEWAEKVFPDNTELEKLFPGIPVYLIRIDGHAGWASPAALKLAGISVHTKINGGEVVVKNGKTTGILIDNAMGLMSKFLPSVTNKQLKKGLEEAQQHCFAAGLTSVTDCGLDKNTILLMQTMQQSGMLKMRINAMLNPTAENFEYFVKNGPINEEKLRVNTIKIYADGALGSRGALLLNDYSDEPGNRGLQIETQAYYDSICQLALDNNFIVATHAIGDSANRMVLNTYAKFLKGKNDLRWRIEHAQVINSADFEKFARYSIVPSIQATHCTSDMFWAEKRLGPERIKGAYAYQTLLKQNGWLPNGTDFPVENIEPLFTFYAAVFRTNHEGNPAGGWHIDEGLTREQTLRSMTIWAAKASFEENTKGSLEPGKFADFVILDTDLMNATPQQILNAKVESTWIAGEKVFELK